MSLWNLILLFCKLISPYYVIPGTKIQQELSIDVHLQLVVSLL